MLLSNCIVGADDSEDDENVYVTPTSNTITNELTNKDNVISFLLPDVITECIPGAGSICSSKNTIKSISSELNIHSKTPEAIMDSAKKTLNCKTEKCVLYKLSDTIETAKIDLETRFKPHGPLDTTLLDNNVIDKVNSQWGVLYDDYYPYNFNMKNYAEYSFRSGHTVHKPDSLAVINFDMLYNGTLGKKYKCCGCIINSDVYQGSGKHWMALFADARSKVWTIEFFNSSGNSPAAEWVNWMMKTKNIMETIIEDNKLKNKVRIIKVTNVRHQQSKSECGVYSLFYLWARINKVPPEYFANPVPDQFMFEFRHHLFDNDLIGDRFDWDQYKKKTNIKWEI